MNSKALATPSLIASILLLPSFASPGPQDPKPEDTQLQRYMTRLALDLRTLGLATMAPVDPVEALELTRRLQLIAMQAKFEEPMKLKDVPEEQREEFVTSYQLAMIPVIEGLLQIERAILEGDHAKAHALQKSVSRLKSDAHKRFRVKN